ncbi:CsbD family protein [Streptomyces gelaticus]
MAHGIGKDKIKGKAEEAMGKSTGDRRKEAEEKIRQAKGGMKKKMSGGHDQFPPRVPPAR